MHQEVKGIHEQMAQCRKRVRAIDKSSGASSEDEKSFLESVGCAAANSVQCHKKLLDLIHETQDRYIRAESRFEANELWLSLHFAAEWLAQSYELISDVPHELERFNKKYNPFPNYSVEVEQVDKVVSALSECLGYLDALDHDRLKAVYFKPMPAQP